MVLTGSVALLACFELSEVGHAVMDMRNTAMPQDVAEAIAQPNQPEVLEVIKAAYKLPENKLTPAQFASLVRASCEAANRETVAKTKKPD